MSSENESIAEQNDSYNKKIVYEMWSKDEDLRILGTLKGYLAFAHEMEAANTCKWEG